MNGSPGRRSLLMRLCPVLLAISLAGCDLDFPRDPEGTLDRVLDTGRMRVALVDNPPWVVVADGADPAGVEVAAIRAFAETLGVDVEWQRTAGFEAFEALANDRFDLAIGGFTRKAVESHAGVSPSVVYFTETLVVAAARAPELPESIEGRDVAVPEELFAEHLVASEGGHPVPDRGSGDLVLLPHWRIEPRGLVPTGMALRSEERVVAVQQGENRWLMRLEQFLRAHAPEVEADLRETAP